MTDFEFESGLPSFRRIQSAIAEKQEIELKLLTGDTIAGKVFWQDLHCLCLEDESGAQIIVWRRAIAYLKPKA